MTGTTTPLLRVRDLVAGYPKQANFFGGMTVVPAIHEVSFDIGTGETLAIVGESGSGKSTTGRAILRLLPTVSGAIEFDGVDITKWGARTPLSYRREVQAVFQDPSASLNPRHLISHTLQLSLQRHGVRDRKERRRRIEEAIEMVGLTRAHLGRFPNELSGGQQQRVGIARALVLNPKLVICDEAVSALDLSTQGQIINLLADLQEATGMSYLFIAHDLGLVRHIAHRVGVMNQGHLVELGDTETVFEHPQDPYTQRLLRATPASTPEGRDERRAERKRARALRATA
ncbi:ATP-binding cassette domain-containing protein [Gulosibacter faecalis]|uniref:ATP-binding cassette domain-containing protein n=1 Tax=Gulosibacter faecalis TaxID=272240 RepID=A0ABW5UZU8_9MICO|nr:ATP-binding cassette domain-containing protein [Gulosibacter faecalis]